MSSRRKYRKSLISSRSTTWMPKLDASSYKAHHRASVLTHVTGSAVDPSTHMLKHDSQLPRLIRRAHLYA
eukprot:911440-Pleurochrysis_carterae.AAC.1